MENSNLSINATKKEWTGLFVLALTCMLYSMDLTVLNLAVPQLSRDLKPSPSQLLWIVDIYGFFLAASLITMGTLGDRIGRRKMLLIGGGLFAVVSAIAAFSKTPEMLIVLRALQGIAGATLAPSTLSLIRVLFKNPKERAVAMGLWGTSFSVGGLIGPIVGGLLIEHFWWGSVLLINLPVMIAMVLLGPILLPEYKDPNAGKIDLISAALSLFAVLLFVLGLKKIAEHGFNFSYFGVLLAGVLLAIIFVRRQSKLTYPLIDLNLFKSQKFNSLMITNFLTMFVLFGTFLFTTQYMQLIMGLSPLVAGVWSMAFSVGFILSSLLSPILARKIKPAYVMSLGLVLGGFGFLVLAQVSNTTDILKIAFGTILFSVGSSPVLLFSTGMLVNTAPSEKAGSAAAISETSNELGGALGIAALGSYGTYLYHQRLNDSANVINKLELAEAIKADLILAFQGTLERALSSVETLPKEIGQRLISGIQNSYIESFRSVMFISAMVLFLCAGFVILRLRDIKLEDEG